MHLVVGSCDSLTVCTEAGTFFPMDTRALNEDILLNVSLIFASVQSGLCLTDTPTENGNFDLQMMHCARTLL